MNALITAARKKYHESLIADNILTIDSKGIPSNADKSSRLSISISRHIIENLTAETHDKITGQSSGAKFETANMQFLCDTFLHLEHLRPGKWHIEKLGNRNNIKTSSFIQYEHLDYLNNIARRDSQLAATLGNDYMVAPDIVIFREPEPDATVILHGQSSTKTHAHWPTYANATINYQYSMHLFLQNGLCVVTGLKTVVLRHLV